MPPAIKPSHYKLIINHLPKHQERKNRSDKFFKPTRMRNRLSKTVEYEQSRESKQVVGPFALVGQLVFDGLDLVVRAFFPVCALAIEVGHLFLQALDFLLDFFSLYRILVTKYLT